MTAYLLQIQDEIGLQLAHIELKVAHLTQSVHLLNEKHRVIFRSCHQKVIISKPHEAIQLNLAIIVHHINFLNSLLSILVLLLWILQLFAIVLEIANFFFTQELQKSVL